MLDLHLALNLEASKCSLHYGGHWSLERFYVHLLPLAYMVPRQPAGERFTLPSPKQELCCSIFDVLMRTDKPFSASWSVPNEHLFGEHRRAKCVAVQFVAKIVLSCVQFVASQISFGLKFAARDQYKLHFLNTIIQIYFFNTWPW